MAVYSKYKHHACPYVLRGRLSYVWKATYCLLRTIGIGIHEMRRACNACRPNINSDQWRREVASAYFTERPSVFKCAHLQLGFRGGGGGVVLKLAGAGYRSKYFALSIYM